MGTVSNWVLQQRTHGSQLLLRVTHSPHPALCTHKVQNCAARTAERFVYVDCTNHKLLLWQIFKQVDVDAIPCCWSFFSASSAWGNTLCKVCKMLSSVFFNSGFEIADSARPGEGTALREAGTVFCMAMEKSFAFILIVSMFICSLSLLSYS